MTRWLWFLSLSLLSVPGPASMQAHRVNAGESRAAMFSENVEALVTLQKALDGSLAMPASPTEADARIARQRALAKALTTARRDARQGDIFTPIIAARFRAIFRDAFTGPDGANIRRTLQEGDPVTLPPLRVNDMYPENAPLATMPPTLLGRLPSLPMELAYRIVGRALVLKDVDTNVIVDVLPDAVPVLR
jgi:hypothetical protein